MDKFSLLSILFFPQGVFDKQWNNKLKLNNREIRLRLTLNILQLSKLIEKVRAKIRKIKAVKYKLISHKLNLILFQDNSEQRCEKQGFKHTQTLFQFLPKHRYKNRLANLAKLNQLLLSDKTQYSESKRRKSLRKLSFRKIKFEKLQLKFQTTKSILFNLHSYQFQMTNLINKFSSLLSTPFNISQFDDSNKLIKSTLSAKHLLSHFL